MPGGPAGIAEPRPAVDNRRVTSPTVSLVRYYDVTSADGTRLRAWTNDADGPTVLISNGLGTNPHAWPSLLRPGSGVRVVHDGDGGLGRVVVASWSTGVTVAFELATRHPERVAGILAVAGVPGNTFSTMLSPLHVPPLLGRALMVGLARSVTVTGHALAPVTRKLPWTNLTTDLVRWSRLISPAADTAELRTLLQEFFTTHPAWYAKLALSVAEHERVSLRDVDVPVTFVAARWDVFTGAQDMLTASQRVRGSRYRELNGTHFIPVEHPDVVLKELQQLLARVG
jgi:3-oxoadipate enol-lactonase